MTATVSIDTGRQRHFSDVIGSKVSRRHPKSFRVVVLRGNDATEQKRYEFEARNALEAIEIVDEIKKNMSQAQMQAYQGIPDEQKQEFLQNLARTSNFALGAMEDRKGGLAGLGTLVQNQNDSLMGLASADAAAKQANQQQLMQQRGIMAEYKDKAFDFNKVRPYEAKAAESQALMGAGLQNIGLGA